MTANSRISNLINSQVPFFVRNDHQKFVTFIEKYYEFLEQTDGVLDVKDNIVSFKDIDYLTRNDNPTDLELLLQEKLYATFLKLFPKDMRVDKTLLLKHAKEFYLSRGSEKSIRFLMNILFAQEDVSFYYPKTDILRASDGKWYIQQSLKINDIKINGVSNSSIAGLEKFINTSVKGNTSGATASIERIDRFYEGGTVVDELVISSLKGTFSNGEEIFTLFNNFDYTTGTATANIFGGILNTVTIKNAGSGYNVGDPVIIESNSGSGANVQVARVTSGNISSITILEGGAGYQNNNYLLVSGGGGSGANGYISLVQADGEIHPNTYNIYYSRISLEANTPINNTKYSNLVSSIVNPYNHWIANSLSSFVYANTGPAKTILITTAGSGYTSTPSISIIANTSIRELGILGRMKINSGGVGYVIGDTVKIENVIGGYGTGALANVTNVDVNGTITQVKFKQVPGHITGGAGYAEEYLPTTNVISSNAAAYGANISVTSLLGYGGSFLTANSTLGAIERLIIFNKGSGYTETPTLNLTQIGDGTATANATIIEGVYSYPGRYLNDDGMLSTYNFLQDRDYYQNFSYVVKLKSSIDNYRQALKNLVHPAGMKLFGEYIYDNNNESYTEVANVVYSNTVTKASKSYLIANNVIINYTGHGLTNADSIYLEFTSGNIANYAANSTTYMPNSIYRVANVIDSNTFTVFSGKYLPGSMNLFSLISEGAPTGIYMKEDGYNMFVVGTGLDRVLDFKLQRKYDITTASFNKQSIGFTTTEPTPTDLTFKPDGTMFYIVGSFYDNVVQYSMSEAWNVNTATYLTSFTTGYANPQAIQISRDGQYLYIIDTTSDEIIQYSMSTAWNVNTASYITKQYIGGSEATATSLYLKSDGESLFITGSTSDVIREFRLPTAWNVNAATIYTSSASLSGFSPSSAGLTFANNGSMVYITDTTFDLIHQLPMTEAWNVNTAFNGTTTTGNVLVGRVI